MKICILTQPLHKNYGGLLQAYALQKYLRDFGHNVFTADIPFKKPSLYRVIRTIIASSVRKYIFNNDIPRVLPLTDLQKSIQMKNTDEFIQEYICRTHKIISASNIYSLEKYDFDAFVVGSDQVWRPLYSPGILTYFLDFLPDDSKAKRIAYAASFGVDNCDEFSNVDPKKISTLLSKFDFVGVREDSAVDLCKDNFDATTTHVIDPTLLLCPEDYLKLVTIKKTPKHNGGLFSYVLDKSPDKQSAIAYVAKSKGLKPYTIMLHSDDGISPPVETWIRGFIDAEFVVTDSFHGVAFSLLFNKPFIAIGNEGRGLARFSSLLKMFNLESRLVFSVNDIDEGKINEVIDFDCVNKILERERLKSFELLDNAFK